jgi:hypothetical protein
MTLLIASKSLPACLFHFRDVKSAGYDALHLLLVTLSLDMTCTYTDIEKSVMIHQVCRMDLLVHPH